MEQNELSDLRRRAAARRDESVAVAQQEYQQTLEAIALVAGLLDPETTETGVQRIALHRTLAERVRSSINQLPVGTFTTTTVLMSLFPDEIPSKSQRANISGTVKRIVAETPGWTRETIGRGKSPSVYRKYENGGDE